MEAGAGVYLSSVSIEVSLEENTITLSGEIPGITPQSRACIRGLRLPGGFRAGRLPRFIVAGRQQVDVQCRMPAGAPVQDHVLCANAKVGILWRTERLHFGHAEIIDRNPPPPIPLGAVSDTGCGR